MEIVQERWIPFRKLTFVCATLRQRWIYYFRSLHVPNCFFAHFSLSKLCIFCCYDSSNKTTQKKNRVLNSMLWENDVRAVTANWGRFTMARCDTTVTPFFDTCQRCQSSVIRLYLLVVRTCCVCIFSRIRAGAIFKFDENVNEKEAKAHFGR